MPSKKDTVHQAVLGRMQSGKMYHALSKEVFWAQLGLDGERQLSRTLEDNVDLDACYLGMCRFSLEIKPTDDDYDSLNRAFKAAGLNSKLPESWRELLSIFTDVHFGNKKTKPKTWNEAAFLAILIDYGFLKKEGVKDSQICKKLRSDPRFKAKYQNYKEENLRKLLRYAKRPEHNRCLRYQDTPDLYLKIVRSEYEAKGMIWTERHEKNLQSKIQVIFEVLRKNGANLG